jgi:hypothetical protein
MPAPRYVWSTHATRDRAETALEDAYASDQISQGERPRIEPAKGSNGATVYRITLPV